MGRIFRVHDLPDDCIDASDSLITTFYLGKAGGGEKLYANIDRVVPGGSSCKFHSHSKQEEFFYILRGKGTLRVGEESREVKAGDFFCKPAGKGLAHQFTNTSNDVLEILDVGSVQPGDEVFYPDEGVTYIKDQKKFLRDGEELSNWSTNPHAQE